MIGKQAEDVLNRAVRYAFERQHEYFTLEHVLLSLLEESEILDCIQATGASYLDIKNDLEKFLDKEVPKRQPKESSSSSSADKSFKDLTSHEDDFEEEVFEHPVATLSIQRLIQRALFHVQSAGKDEIHPEDLFVAIFKSKDSHALHVLKKQGIELLDVLNYISHGVAGDDKDDDVDLGESKDIEPSTNDRPDREAIERKRRSKAAIDALRSFTTNLNEEAKDQKIDPLVGRTQEMERIIQTLCRRRKNNPLLVGEAGVGKTALAEGLALRIVEGDVPPLLENGEVYQLDLGSLLAGAKFRGDFEQRLKRVLAAIKLRSQEGKKPILMIDEIHTIIGAGSVSGGVLDAANLLKPMLSRGELQCMGSTTYNEYRNVFEKDHALARRFQKVDVSEPTREEAIEILEGLAPKFEEHHGVRYSKDAIRAAVDLSTRHITDRFLPDKAIDVLDEVGARMAIEASQKQKEAMQASAVSLDEQTKEIAVIDDESTELIEPRSVTAQDVEAMIAKIARIPARSVSMSQKKRLKKLESDLKLTLFGQDHAIEALVNSIQLARSGLRTGERPIGSFLFTGPTGVGKTELSKQLAHCLGVPFLRYDMSEYMEKHTVSRLIGAPPGYVGFEQAGLLTDAVLKNPYSVILLDEIEKAHMDIWNILLQVMDHGTLTDNNGRKVDFRNTVIIMTSNVGSRELERRKLGVASLGDAVPRESSSNKRNVTEVASRREVEKAFSPEFRNRLDAIVYFNPLDPVTIAQVVGKQLAELESQLLAKGVEIEVDSDVREWLGHEGYDRAMGARPMRRLIQDKIKKPLAQEILFGELENGGKVVVSIKGDAQKLKNKDYSSVEAEFKVTPSAKKEKLPEAK